MTDWMQSHLSDRLAVPSLAARVGVSERSSIASSPKRLASHQHCTCSDSSHAARLLLTSPGSLKGIAGKVGLSPARFAAAFEQRFGITPSLFREVCTALQASGPFPKEFFRGNKCNRMQRAAHLQIFYRPLYFNQRPRPARHPHHLSRPLVARPGNSLRCNESGSYRGSS